MTDEVGGALRPDVQCVDPLGHKEHNNPQKVGLRFSCLFVFFVAMKSASSRRSTIDPRLFSLASQYTDEKFPGPVPLGLQIHGGLKMKVEYRDVRLAEL